MILSTIPILLSNALIGTGTFIIGAVVSYFVTQRNNRRRAHNIIKEAEAEAEMIKKDKILQAKEKFLQLKSEHEKIIADKNLRLVQAETKFKQRESALAMRFEKHKDKKRNMTASVKALIPK